ncbi:hypothetical protein BAY1663_04502 [Pseudomonas sp. BAY1663]|nr:hypothetical protein BAY1663_04502 [Pseudomonas sp. BAY1663]
MVERIVAPQQRAEAAWIGIAQRLAGFEQQVDVLVLGRRQTGINQAQAAGHPQMDDQRAGLEADQQVLGAPLNRLDTLTGQAHVQILGNRPAQAPVAHDHPVDALAEEMRRDTAAGSFDFGEFGHGESAGWSEKGEILA